MAEDVFKLPVDTGLFTLVQLLALNEITADPSQLLHERGRGDEPFDFDDMLRTAKRLGLKARVSQVATSDLPLVPLPAIGRSKTYGFVLLARAEADAGGVRALVQAPMRREPHIWSQENLEAEWDGKLLLLATREGLAGTRRTFDVTWFIPFLVKYRRPLNQVLIASFVIQIVGLLSPIFFQLVIDKVLVHGTLATLDVLAFGLIVVFFWETALSGLRQWLLRVRLRMPTGGRSCAA